MQRVKIYIFINIGFSFIFYSGERRQQSAAELNKIRSLNELGRWRHTHMFTCYTFVRFVSTLVNMRFFDIGTISGLKFIFRSQ